MLEYGALGSILWTYLLCIASFGVYALFLVYRNASETGDRDRTGALAWAAGFLAAPIACAVLYDLGRRARAKRRVCGQAALPSWIAPALHAGIASLLLLSPLQALWSPIWILLPLPLLIVDAQIRGVDPLHGSPLASRSRASWVRPLEAAVLVIGLPAVAWTALELDHTGVRMLMTRAADGAVRGLGARYELTIDDQSWRRLPPGTIGDEEADLELIGPEQRSWVIVYNHGADMDLDSVVDGRRAVIAEVEPLEGFREQRYLLQEGPAAAASVARYRIDLSGLRYAEYVVLTAHLQEGPVEVVTFTARPDLDGDRIADLLSTFEPVEAPAEASP